MNDRNDDTAVVAEKNDDTLLLRLPSLLKKALDKEAALNDRSITAEVNRRLRISLAAPRAEAPTAALLETLIIQLRALSPEKQRALLTLLQ